MRDRDCKLSLTPEEAFGFRARDWWTQGGSELVPQWEGHKEVLLTTCYFSGTGYSLKELGEVLRSGRRHNKVAHVGPTK